MSANKNIQMKQYNGTDYDNLYPTPSAHNHDASAITSGTMSIARGGTGAGTAAEARANLEAASMEEYTATLLSTGWTAQTTGFAQTVAVSGILATDAPIIDCALSGDAAADQLILEAWPLVSRITTAANSITAYAYDDAPTVNLPIKLKVVR